MTSDVVRFILQVAAVFAGGGSVQGLIFLLRRRGELRQLDTGSDATALNAANAYIVTLQAGDKTLREELDAAKAELRSADRRADIERESSAQALENATREISRAVAELSRVKADLIVAQSQVAELGERLSRANRYP